MTLRIDAHQHFWKYNPTDYIWMTEEMDVLRRDLLPEDLKPLLEKAGLDATVAVQARQMTKETAWLLELAERFDFILGVVGWVEFASDALEEQLERYSEHPKLKGVRELIHEMPDVEYALSEAHVRAISLLSRFGLTYDLLLKPPHIEPATRLVDRFPEQPFVVDHIAKPVIREGVMTPWEADIRALAQRPNVYCKLSGMVTECDWQRWTPEQIQPYLDVVLDAFGTDRVMIGSDWPVCTLAGEYVPVMRVVIDYVAALSTDEQERILGGNCARFYGLAKE
ncbi:MAG: amidohydrolase family protein [Trueperaceae bacterium]|nr:MAG: amidohydrolase family protein [Trueperaceae bacterium]